MSVVPQIPLAVTTLVLGGARSGKSGFAEKLAKETGLKRVYIATAQAFDTEMSERIGKHQNDRASDGWHTIEEPIHLATVIVREAKPDTVLLVDCLTLWLSNAMLAELDIADVQTKLLKAVYNAQGPIIFVSNEVGMGLVPETPLGRRFRDAQGRLNQAIAAQVPCVVFVAAGLPIKLKQT
jgi:adenosylcobinamide kinase / adenosylcobinamide-phosphate guanylyltransferase